MSSPPSFLVVVWSKRGICVYFSGIKILRAISQISPSPKHLIASFLELVVVMPHTTHNTTHHIPPH